MNRLTYRSAGTAAALLLLAVSACGGTDSPQSTDSAEETTTESSTQTATTLETAETDLGTVLVNSEGMTVYMFEPDGQGKSTCDAKCLKAWPVVEGPAEPGDGVDGSLLGTTKATDGSTIATYNDWPLYYWVEDQQPGDVTGQAVGDVWWVVGPDGEPIMDQPQTGGSGY